MKKSKPLASNSNYSDNHTENDALAVDVLTWISRDNEQMNRFLALSGLSADNLREAAAEPGFLAGVLGFLMGHEPTLMAYCEDRDIAPDRVVGAWHALAGDATHESSR